MTYQQDVKTVREDYRGAVESAAAEAVRIAEQYGRPLQTVCRDIAGDGWQALSAATKRYKADDRARSRATQQAAARHVRAAIRKNPEAVVREVAKVAPAVVLDVAAEQAGQTRKAAPSNKAKVEQAFGPDEFNRLETAMDALLDRLPDLAPTKDDEVYAETLADMAEAVAQALRAWVRGETFSSEVEQWLST
jgi:hypothetical protein